MFIRFSRLNRILLLLLLSIPAATAFASQPATMVAETSPNGALEEASGKRAVEQPDLRNAEGLLMLDYEVIPVPGNPSLDLLGAHYLHQLNSWLYLGAGVHAPLLYGNYGGFMTFDATLHAQYKVIGDLFVDAGVSVGGGGGGSTINQSKSLSGTGGFIKSYAGLGYDFHSFSAGVNYTRFRFTNSLINHSQLNLFVQKPVSFSAGSYADSGRTIESGYTLPESAEKILTLELNNLFQIQPKGLNRKTINTVALQFSRFLTENHYLFFAADVGYNGLPLYNQVLAGVGYRLPISSRVNLYSQIGVGSGGYSPAEIDTGPGLLVYPKLSAEYLLNNSLGLSLSGGYLFAPKGSSKNHTVGAAMNYHLSAGDGGSAQGVAFRGFRLHLFHQTQFNVRVGNNRHANLNLISLQLDNILSDHWYLPIQAGVAYNDFVGYPGYGEILAGLGVQTRYSATDRFQGFFQLLVGANANNILLKPTVACNYGVSDNLALYGQFAKTISLNKFTQYPVDVRLSSYALGLGLTYRFSIPESL